MPNPNLRQLPQPLSNSRNEPHLLGSTLLNRGARAGGLILNRSTPVNHTNLPDNLFRIHSTVRQVSSTGSISRVGQVGQVGQVGRGFGDAWLVFAQLASGFLPAWSTCFVGLLGYTGFKRSGRLIISLLRQRGRHGSSLLRQQSRLVSRLLRQRGVRRG
ncbi:hypothetical protein EV651_122113 [Kribbella sp. VKM Ac-2571]|uniref:hypothetical protein n=1 Tax=Kribbella sp. VKM Ac-2571 TaxID=2512222 RepID=UPI0010EC82B5|nr:hypothetical protein [Kribbella sp. VKM Ac-2571]TDO48988.1 hypothetical protein EV651_122113 [Kribbella sp. VKM Ac-2571]